MEKFELLLIEDSLADAQILQEALTTCGGIGAKCHVTLLTDSRDAIPFLREPERITRKPNLIVLDYKMPIDGGLALVALKGDPAFLHIPVVAVTGVTSPKEICDIYQRGANCCYHKPSDLDGYEQLARMITDHWLTKICVPSC